MAIAIKPGNGIVALAKLGVGQDAIDWLKVGPAKVQLTAERFHLSLPLLSGDEVTAVVPVTLDALQQLSAGTLSNASKGMLREKLEKAIKGLRSVAEESPELIDHDAPALPKPNVGLAALPPATVAKPAAAPVLEPAWAEFDLKKLATAQTVPLREAKQMYQPVTGTSSGSRYFMVAAGEGIRVAARYKGTQLSVRVEGAKLDQYKLALTCAQMKLGSDYASLHLDVGNLGMAAKTLGAVLLGLGIPLETPIPDLKKMVP